MVALRTLVAFGIGLLVTPAIANGAATSARRTDPLPRSVWCNGFWNGCGEQCPPQASHFETRRSCTINNQKAYEYWCCNGS
ncbi:hypothetical protein SCLCIDRAFT_112099 [Scleroderma citrinum Foug A]|uniref:CBM1 domain-containing protein n=1 Tax=Scleroderma citrinum Foug A TaxID=1036808 RepID=A0A0C2ZWR4_9AGAM|nr:hypothetical protein SCLCIDRAFT_112099 [Scleroderma citrinum Foug A]